MTAAERDALAAEHVLGVLDEPDAARAARLVESDAEFAALVEAWRTRLAEIDATAPAQPAGEALWLRIEGGLGGTLPVLSYPSLADRLIGLWNSLGFWRGAGLVAGTACLALTAGLVVLWARPPAPVLIAALLTEDNRVAAIVNVAADGRTDLIPLADVPVPSGRALQVWTLWDRSRGPVSVGLTRTPRRLDLRVGDLPRAVPDQLFEITLEPESGSPTGRPTGPVLMKGLAARTL
ncbi:anti-sigma factor [Methylobacterium crusticola]|uniref:anti-sigma factor n=1 Tax=Methylobacterium crusticola TaxID=1697972 RepID=UPI000FFB9E07|nr:anti-sigma factor [Methylobacterium crusticola]